MRHEELMQRLGIIVPNLGWISVGIGDSFAAIIGNYYGRNKWKGTSRTMEGSCGMFLSMIIVSFLLLFFSLDNSISLHDRIMMLFTAKNSIPIMITMAMTSLMEAFTSENDNLVLPLFSVAIFTAVTIVTL
jgi:dolichol kinase